MIKGDAGSGTQIQRQWCLVSVPSAAENESITQSNAASSGLNAAFTSGCLR